MKLSTLIATTLIGFSAMATSAVAAEQIKLTVLSGYGPKASWVRVFRESWMPEVQNRLAETGNYELDFIEAFGTVVKPRGELEGTQKGIGDIGLIVSVFHADKLPLTSVSFVTPFVTTDLGLNARVYDQLTEEFPAMLANWGDYNMEFLGHMGTIKSYAVLSKEPITSIEDFSGKKFAGAGLNLRWISGLDAAGVPSALTKFYSDVDSGVADGMIAWPDAIAAFKLCEAAPNLLLADMGAVTSFAVTVNKDTWDGLPEEVQKAMRAATSIYRDELAAQTTAGDAKGVEACEAQGGSVYRMPADERAKWAAALPPIAREWADAADAKGLPGKEVLARYMELMRENDQPIARDWDKE